jgi:hypothetical protein
VKIEILIKPCYGTTIGLHLHPIGWPWIWRPHLHRIGRSWSLHWMDFSITVRRFD